MGFHLNIGKCWRFSDDEQPPYPTIELNVSSADRNAAISPKVDTGFNGSLAIGIEVVKKLRLTPAGTVLVRTAAGNREVPVYALNLSQPDLGISYATLAIGTERSLVGRKILNDRTWLLDCKEERFCIIAQTEMS